MPPMDHWEISFDEHGKASQAEIGKLLGELPGRGLTDLLVFSHGWNSDRRQARRLYELYFGQVPGLLASDGAQGVEAGWLGVVWPSKRWADEPEPTAGADGGGVAGLGDGGAAGAGPPVPSDPLLVEDLKEVFERFADAVPQTGEGGAAGIGDTFGRLWNGAKEALRQLTYFEMKKRAGAVGKDGLGPLLGRIHQADPQLRIHLIGHSFGARLVSFALAGLPDPADSPVKSLYLLQGAFSHFAFADALPMDRSRGGALKGMAARVDGPLVASFSIHDTAVGKLYPLASLSSRDDAAGLEDRLFRWGGIGHDGAQAVDATVAALAPVGSSYPFQPGRFVNLDGNAIVNRGGPPAGAHSDIFPPEVVWAGLAAAGLVAT